MLTAQEKMEALITLSMELNQVRDIDILMEHILNHARKVGGADAGTIFLREENKLKFSYTQ
ncbi:MAG: phosphohydrolase, partial [Desulfobacterales bacterium]|nr:phosphohydrolase [Desulfobacterales bacterium]